jgi:hypothetical protein
MTEPLHRYSVIDGGDIVGITQRRWCGSRTGR